MDLPYTIGPGGTNGPSLRPFTEGGECPGDNDQEGEEWMRKEIDKLEAVEMGLAIKYGIDNVGGIDSVEVFEEAKARAFLGNPEFVLDAERMDRLGTLRAAAAQRALYFGRSEVVSPVNASRDRIYLERNINVDE
ncbi:hypothetical protein IW261DRAFT_1571824 [Armillaria novae-zelandiae]|uniref:Uncharacterized protein n=1 Tax=Armillaria novae-zelandiae TaxID=153914 RepID=A0AA39NTY6_9AGAR|nr:hypothetical protein IW261DRAFT_1571824 [Armillaria novae-zelandiae]